MNTVDNISKTQFEANTGVPQKAEMKQAAPEMKKDGKKKIMLGMAATAAVAVAGIAIAVKTGKANKAAQQLKNLAGNAGDGAVKAAAKEKPQYSFDEIMQRWNKADKAEEVNRAFDDMIRRKLLHGTQYSECIEECAKLKKTVEDFLSQPHSHSTKTPR